MSKEFGLKSVEIKSDNKFDSDKGSDFDIDNDKKNLLD